MHAKQSNSQGRRTLLSLSAGVSAPGPASSKPQHDPQYPQSMQKGKSAATNGSNGAKNESKNAMQSKTEPTLAELKKQQKLLQQQQANENKKSMEKSDEKRNQNGSNSSKNAINGKEKQSHNGKNDKNAVVLVAKEKEKNVEQVVEKLNEKIDKNLKKNNKEEEKDNSDDNDEKEVEAKLEQAKNEKEKDGGTNGDSNSRVVAPVKSINEKEKKITTPNKLIEKDGGPNEASNSRAVASVKVINEKEKKITTPTKLIEEPQKTTPQKNIEKEQPRKVTPLDNGESDDDQPQNGDSPSKEKSENAVAPVVVPSGEIHTTDVDMESLNVEASPKKRTQIEDDTGNTNVIPTATSTPGKMTAGKGGSNAKSEIQLAMQGSPDRSNCPRSFSHISGRRSIRPFNEFGSMQFRESYRRIKTDLDLTAATDSSLNVTVGSEVPNNSSFSFFGRGRKRDRTPTQSTVELHNDNDMSPPKRVRLDMHSFFSVVASPLTLLRSRFSKTSIQSSTPVKLSSKLAAEDEGEVQNVSGVSIHEEIPAAVSDAEEVTATEEITAGNDSSDDDDELLNDSDTPQNEELAEQLDDDGKCEMDMCNTYFDEEIQIKETPIAEEPLKRKCIVM